VWPHESYDQKKQKTEKLSDRNVRLGVLATHMPLLASGTALFFRIHAGCAGTWQTALKINRTKTHVSDFTAAK
jgi:hypothetical protein